MTATNKKGTWFCTFLDVKNEIAILDRTGGECYFLCCSPVPPRFGQPWTRPGGTERTTGWHYKIIQQGLFSGD
jgi:hypothetical protein